MNTLYLASMLLLAAPLLVLHLLSVTLARALRSYSRSRLEALAGRAGRPALVAEVGRLDEATERAAEVLAVLTGLMLAALLGVAAQQSAPAFAVESVAAIALAIGSVGYVLSGVLGRVLAERVLLAAWPATATLRMALRPLTFSFGLVERLAERLAGDGDAAPRPASVEVEIPADEVDPGEDVEAELPESARTLLRHVVTLTQRDVSALMTPRSRLVWLPATVTAAEAAEAFRASGRSRIPLYGETHDDVVGVLHARDLFGALIGPGGESGASPRKLARPAYLVPETKNAFDLLDEFRRERTRLAVVLDEYGGVAGVVTLEDILEALVGPIDDEHDAPRKADPIEAQQGGGYAVDAGVAVAELNERLGLHLPTDEGYNTVGGLAYTTLGRVPEPGACFRSHGVEFRVLEVAAHAIRRLAVDPNPAPAPAGAGAGAGAGP